MKKGYPWPNVNPATGMPVAPYFRNRHLRMGEGTARTSPPSKVQGPPSADRVVPYLENAPSSALGGTYDAQTRAVGLDEPPTAAVINRPTYDLSCNDDVNIYQCLAKPKATAISLGAPTDHIEFSGVVYLGVPGTQKTLGAPAPSDYAKTPRAFIEIRSADAFSPILDDVTGNWVLVEDVQSSRSVSFYNDLPNTEEAFPFGRYGVIYRIRSSGGAIPNDQIQFAGPFPSGCPAAPSDNPVGLFNYSLWERSFNSTPGDATATNAFASCEQTLTGTPDLVQVNRDLTSAGWLPGDIVYTTRFAYKPYIVTSSTVSTSPVEVLFGEPWFGIEFFEYFGSRLVGMSRREPREPAFTVTEPSSAAMYSFDSANALFRAYDRMLRGTVGFDFKGRSEDDSGNYDAYAGFLHRKLLHINNDYTNFPPGTSVSYNRSTGVVTITGTEYFASGAPLRTCLIPGHDLIELENEGVFILDAIYTAATAGLKKLDGSSGGGSGVVTDRATIYRPQLRTGALSDAPGATNSLFGGNVMCGDAFFTGTMLKEKAALTMITGGSSYLARGWDFPDDRRGSVVSGTAYQGVWDLWHDGGMRFGPRLYGGDHDQSWLWTTELDTSYNSNYIAYSARLLQYANSQGHPWASSYDPSMRLVSVCPVSSSNVLQQVTLRINSAKVATDPYYHGLDSGSGTYMDHHVALLLGDPHDVVSGPSSPNYAGIRAKDPAVGGSSGKNSISMFLHRDGATLSADSFTGADDLFAMLRERDEPLPYGEGSHPRTGAYQRFELSVGDDTDRRTVDYGWSDFRTFYHHVPLQSWRTLASSSTAETWFYGNSSYTPPPGYTFPTKQGISFLYTGNATNRVELPLTLPHCCRIKSVLIKYWHDNWESGGNAVIGQVQLREQDTRMGSSTSEPDSNVLGTASLSTSVGWSVVTLTPSPAVEVDIENKLYFVRVVGSYDDGGSGGQTTQLIAGVLVKYEMQSFMPA